MKKCNDCNVEMIEDCIIEGQHPFEIGSDGRTDISIHIPTGEKGKFFGVEYNKTKALRLKARICPSCGKIELYANMHEEE